MHSVDDIVKALRLEPHPEGGYYRRTYKNQNGPPIHGGGAGDDSGVATRGHASAIYYLQMPEFSLWHRTDGDELWFWHAGAPLSLEIRQTDASVEAHTLGSDFLSGQSPQLLAPANKWQRAKSLGNWTLVSCSVSPGFLFETYELEPADTPG